MNKWHKKYIQVDFFWGGEIKFDLFLFLLYFFYKMYATLMSRRFVSYMNDHTITPVFFFLGGGGGGVVIATAIIISLIEATVIKIAYCGWVELTVLSSFKPERWWQWRSRPGQQLTERRGEGKKWRRGGLKHYQEKGIDRDHLNWKKSCVIYNRLF